MKIFNPLASNVEPLTVFSSQTTGAQQQKWYNVVQGIMNASSVFFSTNPNNVMMEVACESTGKCDTDQQSFKGYLARWMAASIKVAPFVESWVMPRLQASAQSAVMTCTAGIDGNQCHHRSDRYHP